MNTKKIVSLEELLRLFGVGFQIEFKTHKDTQHPITEIHFFEQK